MFFHRICRTLPVRQKYDYRNQKNLSKITQNTPKKYTAIKNCPYSTESGSSLLDLVKVLRKETQAGIADCREALIESNKDIEKAKEWLQKKAKKVAAKKGNRATYEGGVLANAPKGAAAVLVEMNCETDFAAKESNFTSVVRDIAKTLCYNPTNDVQKLMTLPHASPVVGGVPVKDVSQAIESLTGLLKENVKLRRIATFPAEENILNFSYVHGALDSIIPPLGRIGVLLRLRLEPPTTPPPPSLSTLGTQLCVQIAASNPEGLYQKQTEKQTENPEEESILVKQEYLFDSSVTVGQELEKFKKKNGAEVVLLEFLRWELGEGMERVEANLAADVEALLKEKKA